MDIRPFRGWRYAGTGDISKLIAPPYDILSGQEKQQFLAGSDKNIVAVDLPHVPPKEVGPDSEYQAAADLLKQWQKSGVLAQDAPAIYVYEQAFSWASKPYCRRAILCGVRGTKLGEDVIPHEHTFAGPKADRLKLTQMTRIQLSPIFGFYHEAGGMVRATIDRIASGPASVTATLRGVKEKLWAITDAAIIQTLAAELKPLPVYIADGHHRYTTALNYRDGLKATQAVGPDHEANFVMFALVERDDPGLLILPTHRIFRSLGRDFTLAKLIAASPQFTWRKCDRNPELLADADGLLSPFGPSAMAVLDGKELWIATLADPGSMAQAAPEETPAWRELDVAILHKLLVDQNLAPWRTAETVIEYTPDGRSVLEACRKGGAQLGFCLQGTPLAAVEKIANTGATMPHKSTYFYPKLATGMVLKPLE